MTLRWPWTSKARLDDALEQVEWLRAENGKLGDALVRIRRVEQGMAETPRKPRADVEEMPVSLVKYFNGFDNASMAKQLRQEAMNLHRAGEPWTSIQNRILEKIES